MRKITSMTIGAVAVVALSACTVAVPEAQPTSPAQELAAAAMAAVTATDPIADTDECLEFRLGDSSDRGRFAIQFIGGYNSEVTPEAYLSAKDDQEFIIDLLDSACAR